MTNPFHLGRRVHFGLGAAGCLLALGTVLAGPVCAREQTAPQAEVQTPPSPPQAQKETAPPAPSNPKPYDPSAWLRAIKVEPTTSLRPPLTAYSKMPDIEEISISPSGNLLAMIKHTDTDRFIVVMDADKNTLVYSAAISKTKVRSVQFLNEDLIGISMSSKSTLWEFGGYQNEIYQFLWVNLKTKKTQLAFDRADRLYNMVTGPVTAVDTPVGTKLYASNIPIKSEAKQTLYALDPVHGGAREIDEGGRFWLVRPNGDLAVKSEYNNSKHIWYLKFKINGFWKTVFSDKFEIESPTLLGFDTDNQSVILNGVFKDKGIGYFSVTPEGNFTKLNVPGRPIFNENNLLIGYAKKEMKLSYQFLDQELNTQWKAITKALPKAQVSLVSYNRDYSRLIVSVNDDNKTGSYFFYDKATHKLDIIGESYPEVPDDWIAKVRTLHYKAADGLEIPAYVTLPPGRQLKNLPLIVMPHGGPFARDYYDFDYWAQALASRGYVVLQPQFRGSSGFGYRFEAAGRGEMGQKMQTDLSDGVRHLASLGLIDPKRVCIFGWSYGGYAALAGAAFDPGVYRCAASGAGVSDFKKSMSFMKDKTGSQSESVNYWNLFLGPKDGWDAKSPARNVDKITIPILLIHGADDTRVSPEQSQFMYEQLKRADKPVDYVVLPKEDHFLSREATRIQMLETLIPFLERNNPPQ